MAIGTPFHARTSALCQSYDWRQWSGYYSASSYNDFVQPEYAAIRNSAALIDVSPLYKYWVRGRDASRLVNRIITQNAEKLGVGRVTYTPWCDTDGKVRQEGTVFRLAEDLFQVCAAEPALDWIGRNAVGYEATIEDRSTDFGALSLQGPSSRRLLADLLETGGSGAGTAPTARDAGSAGAWRGVEIDPVEVEELRFFGITRGTIAGVPVAVSRTGYTGDLGYEIWIPAERALLVWDALLDAGRRWQVTPCGMLAMDIARAEAGFVLINVDYVSSEHAESDEQKTSAYELGLGWAVKLDSGNFVGRRALAAEKERGSARRVVGLSIDWKPLERAYLAADLMPDLPMTACRKPVPVYSIDEGRQVGRVTTRVWSKLLKKYIGMATVETAQAAAGTSVAMEVTVNWRRERVPASVVDLPFYRPDRMRS